MKAVMQSSRRRGTRNHKHATIKKSNHMSSLTCRYQSLAIAALAVLLAACASREFVPTEPGALHEAASATLAQSVYIRTLTDQCVQLGGESELKALEFYQDWLDLNTDAVAAADRYYTRELQPVTHNYQGMDLALEAVHLSHIAQQRAIAQLDLHRRSITNRHITCTRELQRAAQNQMNVVTQNRHLPYVNYLRKQYPGQGDVIMASVPTLAARIPLDVPAGRSYYVQEEQIKQLCPTARIIVLYNQWPHEAYGAYCENQPIAFISCEWGHCQQVEL
jgi:hypothetical protein